MPEIIVEFVPDLTKLKTGMDQITASGGVTQEFADQLKAAQKPIDDLAKKTAAAAGKVNHSFDDMSKHMQAMTREFLAGFREGVTDALKDAIPALDHFGKETERTTKAATGLKAELNELKLRMQEMKDAGQDGTAAYAALRDRAGEVADAISGVNDEIKGTASDTRKLDTAVEALGAMAAAGEIAAGAQVLLGDKSEAFEEVMTRLNALMAVSNGLQVIGNVIQKESNVMRGIGALQAKASAAATSLETAAQSRNIVVKGAANVAMKVLNATMKANPIFLLVSALALLGGALAFFAGRAKDTKETVDALNASFDAMKSSVEGALEIVEFEGDKAVAQLEATGAAGSKITKQRIQNLNDVSKASIGALSDIDKQYSELSKKRNDLKPEEYNDQLKKIRDFETSMLKNSVNSQRQAALERIKLQGDIRKEAKDAADKAEDDAKKAEARRKELELQRLNDQKAAIERQLLNVQEGSEQELKLRQKLVTAESAIELFNEKLSANERLLIQEKALKERARMQKEFYDLAKKMALENSISEINAELNALNVSAGIREDFTVASLQAQRDLELSEVKNNEAKRAEIIANYDKQIRDARFAIRDEQNQREIEHIQLNDAARKRALERELADEKTTADRRAEIIDQLDTLNRKTVERQLSDLENMKRAGLISESDYLIQYKRLKDQELQLDDATDQKKKENDAKRIEDFKKAVDQTAQYMTQALDAIGGVFDALAAREQQRIELLKAANEQAREAGAITEKEFIERQRRLEVEQKRQALAAARREKAMNIFSAVINGAAAVVKAAPNPLLIAFTAALAAAQIAAIIAQPLPKFGKGTKSAPAGPAIVGETGAEIVQTGDGYFVADHPQIVWMKGGERVFNPAETREIMMPAADRSLMHAGGHAGAGAGIDADALAAKIGAEIGRHPRVALSLDKHGLNQYLIDQFSKTQYLNNRYRHDV